MGRFDWRTFLRSVENLCGKSPPTQAHLRYIHKLQMSETNQTRNHTTGHHDLAQYCDALEIFWISIDLWFSKTHRNHRFRNSTLVLKRPLYGHVAQFSACCRWSAFNLSTRSKTSLGERVRSAHKTLYDRSRMNVCVCDDNATG